MFDLLVGVTAIVTFLFFLVGGILKGLQNLSYARKTKSECFRTIEDETELNAMLEKPMTLDIRQNKASIEQIFYINFSERIYDLESFCIDDEYTNKKDLFELLKTNKWKYDKQFIEWDTSIIDCEEALIWSTEIREFYSMGKLKWKTITGMKGEFVPSMAAGRERKLAVNIVYKHTFKSFIFHFFQR